jgi:hypothetical protein
MHALQNCSYNGSGDEVMVVVVVVVMLLPALTCPPQLGPPLA